MTANNQQAESRSRSLDELSTGVLDVLVVGGGIVGAGVARDAAMRGLRVGLVDAHDFAFGSSSRSSRLLHGGLRYLAQGRIGMVREASREKMIIRRIAPHLAEPLPFIFPTRRGTAWPLWKLRIGVKLYDALCGGDNLGSSSSMDRQEALARLPQLSAERLTGAVRYFDGFTNDARLVLDTLRSAASAGAILRNYCAAAGVERRDDLWRCQLLDRTSQHQVQLSARCVVNAAGAWAQGFSPSRVRLRLTKGVHLVIDRQRLPVPEAVVMGESRRLLFAIPWGQRVIVGTTDTDYQGPLESPTCEQQDVDYIVQVINAAFPTARLTAADVISAWAGLRPLIAQSARHPSDISRRHEIHMTEPGWFDVAGGKLTTSRLMAEQTVDQVVCHARLDARPCLTAQIPLLQAAATQFSGILPPPVSRAAVEHYCLAEWAIYLDDVMVRRTNWRHYHPDHLHIARQVAIWMSQALGWDAARQAQELARYAA